MTFSLAPLSRLRQLPSEAPLVRAVLGLLILLLVIVALVARIGH